MKPVFNEKEDFHVPKAWKRNSVIANTPAWLDEYYTRTERNKWLRSVQLLKTKRQEKICSLQTYLLKKYKEKEEYYNFHRLINKYLDYEDEIIDECFNIQDEDKQNGHKNN